MLGKFQKGEESFFVKTKEEELLFVEKQKHILLVIYGQLKIFNYV